MGAIIGDILGGIISGIIGGLIGFIIPAVKTTLFFGGDALICGCGNWFMNIIVDPIVSTVCGPIVGGGCSSIVDFALRFIESLPNII